MDAATQDHYITQIQEKVRFEISPELISAILVIVNAICSAFDETTYVRRAQDPSTTEQGKLSASIYTCMKDAGYRRPLLKAMAVRKAFTEVSKEMQTGEVVALREEFQAA